ncbi:MAG: dockerin type I domain-containing protein [Candidatus Daviesbacteria bacterium]|nr:dockerin type I domain-containing protein [Candidatus Daviesbacteria bacterium]
MKNILNKFKIPTVLGLGLIFFGLASGVFLVLREQVFLSKAAPDLIPQNITISNITDSSAVVSWETNSTVFSFVSFSPNSLQQQTILDDRDTTPKPHLIHYVTIKKLLPKTKYQFSIISGKNTSETLQFETSAPLTNQNEFTPVIGSVSTGNSPLDEGIIYLSFTGATIQSALIKKGGNFLIPVSQIAKDDLSGAFSLTDNMPAKLTVRSSKGESGIQFYLKANMPPLPPIKLGQNTDLTAPEETPQYDLNGDGKINAADNAVILQNFGKKPKDPNIDLNSDGKVDQKDLDLMSQKLKTLGSQ